MGHRHVKFQVVTDQETGECGILPNIFRSWSNYSPAIGVGGLGHDLLEHGTRETGAFHQEVAAHGGYGFIRLLSGHLDHYGNNAYNVTIGFARSWRDSTYAGIADPPKMIILSKIEHEQIDNLFAEARVHAINEWAAEQWSLDGIVPECPYTDIENWSKIIQWFKYGFARAKKRFKGNSYAAWKTFGKIGDVIDKNWDNLVEHADTGREFTLVIDYDNGDAWLRDYD
jgi:hypothetical protein